MAVNRDSGGNIRWSRGLGGKDWEKRAKIPHEKEREHVDTKGWRLVSEMAEKYGDSRNTTAEAAAESVELRGKEMCVGKVEMSTEKSEDSWSENVAGGRSLTEMVGRAISGLRRQSMKLRLLGFLSLIREEWGNKKNRGEENQCKAMEIRRRKKRGSVEVVGRVAGEMGKGTSGKMEKGAAGDVRLKSEIGFDFFRVIGCDL